MEVKRGAAQQPAVAALPRASACIFFTAHLSSLHLNETAACFFPIAKHLLSSHTYVNNAFSSVNGHKIGLMPRKSLVVLANAYKCESQVTSKTSRTVVSTQNVARTPLPTIPNGCWNEEADPTHGVLPEIF